MFAPGIHFRGAFGHCACARARAILSLGERADSTMRVAAPLNFKARGATPRRFRWGGGRGFRFCYGITAERCVAVVAAAKHATSTLTLSKFQLSLVSRLSSIPPSSTRNRRDDPYGNIPTRAKSVYPPGMAATRRKTEGETLCIIRQEIPRGREVREGEGGPFEWRKVFLRPLARACARALINPLSIRAPHPSSRHDKIPRRES